MFDRDEEIPGKVEEPRTFGSHFSARCRWITLAVSMWGFGFLVFEKTGGSTTSLAPDMALVLLLPFIAGLILLLISGGAQRPGEGCEDSFASLVFLGLGLFGLSYIFFALDGLLSGWVEVGGLLSPCMLLLYSVGGLSLLVLGMRQLLARDWRFVDRRVFLLSLFTFWLFIAMFLILMVYSRLTIMRWSLFSEIIDPWGSLTLLIFLDNPLDVSQGQPLSRVISYLVRGPFIWLTASIIPLLLLKARSRMEVDLIGLAKRSSRAFGVGFIALGVCFVYAVPVFLLGVDLPRDVFLEEGQPLDVARPVAMSLILASFLLAAGIPLLMRGVKVKLAGIRWPALGLLLVLMIPSLLSVAATLSSVRLGSRQPGPAYVLLPFSILVMAITLAILLFWPDVSLPSPRARQYFSLLGVAILLGSFTPSMAGYYRAVIKDVRVDLSDLGPVGTARRTQVAVSFTIKNRGPECHRLGVRFHVDDVPTTWPEYVYIDKLGEGEEVTKNMTFQVVMPKTYSVTIRLFRDVEISDNHIRDGRYLDGKSRRIRIEKRQT